jgi:hypothetical protein
MVVVTAVLALFAGWTLWEIRTASERDQRAWVGPYDFVQADIQPNSRPTFTALASNTGKTPALEFTFGAVAQEYLKGQEFKPVYTEPEGAPSPSVAVVEPGTKLRFTTLPSWDVMTSEHIEHLKQGLVTWYFYGRMEYKDIFGKTHHTTYCAYVGADLKTVYACNTYNTAD